MPHSLSATHPAHPGLTPLGDFYNSLVPNSVQWQYLLRSYGFHTRRSTASPADQLITYQEESATFSENKSLHIIHSSIRTARSRSQNLIPSVGGDFLSATAPTQVQGPTQSLVQTVDYRPQSKAGEGQQPLISTGRRSSNEACKLHD
jgi:hypothetical protein